MQSCCDETDSISITGRFILMVEKRKFDAFHITIYLVVFFVIWSVRELVLRPVWLDQFDGLTFEV